jgi:hypothetical protein
MQHYRRGLLIAMALAVASCAPRDRRAERAIAHAVARGPGAIVDLGATVPGLWSRCHVFAPYTDTATIDRALGFHWRGARRSGIVMSDAVTLLVFTDGPRVVRALELTRSEGDFAAAARPGGHARDSARFVVERAADALVDGTPHLLLRPAP